MAETLIERLECGPGSRELSDECLRAMGWTYRHDFLLPPDWLDKDKNPSGNVSIISPWPPDPSQNLQDTLDWMVPEGWFTARANEFLGKRRVSKGWFWQLMKADESMGKIGEAASPALALSAASLRARETMKESSR